MRVPGRTPHAPSPAGPYSQSARVGSVVVSSGQGGHRPDGFLPEGIVAQTEQCLVNVLAVLRSAGADESDVVSVRVFLTDVDDFTAMNAVYSRKFSEPYPARTTVYVGLPAGLLVEIEALAVTEMA